MKKIDQLLEVLKEEIRSIENFEEQVNVINKVRKEISKVSPFKNEPVDCVLWIKNDRIDANDYNPNVVAGPEFKLLHTSIKEDGYTQPIVAFDLQGEDGKLEVVDGFHRNRIGREYKDIERRVHGYLPVSTIEKPLEERIASTIRHNRARGTHQIKSMSEIVLELAEAGWRDEEICKKLGMDLDEVIRLKQITGLTQVFQNHQFSKSWDEFEHKYYDEGEN